MCGDALVTRKNDGRKVDHRTLEAVRVEHVATGIPAVQVGADLAALGLHRRTTQTWLATERTEGREALWDRTAPQALGPAAGRGGRADRRLRSP